MSGELKSGAGSGKSLYFLLMSGAKFLNKTTFVLDAAIGTYSNYAVVATEQGTTGIYVADFPASAPAGDYDVYCYEAVNAGTPTQGDPFAAGGFTVHWNGTALSAALGSGVDATVALITLDDAKQYLKVTTTNDDAIIAVLINSISVWVRNFLKRDLVSKSYTEYYSGDGSFELVLKNAPIVTLTSINIDSLRQFAASNLVDLTNVIVKSQSGVLRSFNLLYGWTWGESNIKVNYTAGFTISANGGAGTLPHDIRLGVKRILEKQYRQGYTHRKLDTKSESISGMNVTFDTVDIPGDVKNMLVNYRRLLPVSQYEYAD